IVAEYSGAVARDQATSNFQTAAPSSTDGVTTGSVTTTSPDLVICSAEDTTGAPTISAGTGFTKRAQTEGLVLEDLTQSGQGPIVGTFTNSIGPSRVESNICTFTQSRGLAPYLHSPMGG